MGRSRAWHTKIHMCILKESCSGKSAAHMQVHFCFSCCDVLTSGLDMWSRTDVAVTLRTFCRRFCVGVVVTRALHTDGILQPELHKLAMSVVTSIIKFAQPADITQILSHDHSTMIIRPCLSDKLNTRLDLS